MASQALTTRRSFVQSVGAVAAVAAVPAVAVAAESVGYTVAQHIADMEAAGVKFTWAKDGVLMGVRGVNWPAYTDARRKADAAGITDRAIWEFLGERRKDEQIAEIMQTRSELNPLQRTWFDNEMRAYFDGEPNAINGTLDYTYEEWVASMPKSVRQSILNSKTI